jgi:diacylglycerol kinase (ATP)
MHEKKQPSSTHTSKYGIKKRIRSFGYAFRGMYELVRYEPNAQIHFLAAIAAVAMGFWLGISAAEWCAIIICIAVVFAAEAFNTAIEKLVDHLFTDYHETARVAKDVAAGAVLFCAIGAAMIGAIIFGPKIWAIVFN